MDNFWNNIKSAQQKIPQGSEIAENIALRLVGEQQWFTQLNRINKWLDILICLTDISS